jgi:hypothetical protein
MLKKTAIPGALTFYVPSETDPKRKPYMVVFVMRGRKWQAFCQCNDFFGRKLPHLGTKKFAVCKHIEKVQKEVLAS